MGYLIDVQLQSCPPDLGHMFRIRIIGFIGHACVTPVTRTLSLYMHVIYK